MSAHTPGPWRKGINDDSVVSDACTEDQRGFTNFKYYGGHLIAESIENHNIPLIAAAPEMLDALKVALRWADKDWVGYESVASAIAKAEGGSL